VVIIQNIYALDSKIDQSESSISAIRAIKRLRRILNYLFLCQCSNLCL